MPCNTSMRSSSGKGRESRRAFRLAVSGEMAMSTTYWLPAACVRRWARLARRAPVPCACAGNDKTSVGPRFLRNVQFSRAIATSLTNCTATPCAGNPSSRRTRSRNRANGPTATGTRRCRFNTISDRGPSFGPASISTGTIIRRSRGGGPCVRGGAVFIVCFDDLLHKIVANHVPLIEVDEGDTANLTDDLHGLDQAGTAPGGQINLRNVSGDHGFGVESQPGQKHFHLLAGGILRLIQNDERVVQCAAAHECQQRPLNNYLLQVTIEFVGVQQIVDGVVQRAHVRIDLFLQSPRKKTQPLPRFHRRARQDDPVYLLGQQ